MTTLTDAKRYPARALARLYAKRWQVEIGRPHSPSSARWCGHPVGSAGIAERLNAEGFRPPKRTDRFTGPMVLRLMAELSLSRRAPHGSAAGLRRNEYRPTGLARRLGVPRDTVRRWLRAGWLNTRRDADGHHIIWADADELRRLRALRALPRTWANKARLAELQKPKRRPAR